MWSAHTASPVALGQGRAERVALGGVCRIWVPHLGLRG